MKTIKHTSHLYTFGLSLTACACLVLWMTSATRAAEQRTTVSNKKEKAEETDNSDDKQNAKKNKVIIESVEKDDKDIKEVAWLGVSSEEATEVLSVQLGLNSGEGLVLNYVAEDSPAAKAGLQKNYVLVELDGQMLVHPSQLRKLVRMHKEGDKVNLTVYRSGKKESFSATLGKMTEKTGWIIDPSMQMDMHNLGNDIKAQIDEGIHDQMKNLHEALASAGVDRDKLQLEIQKSLEQAHKGIADALHHTRYSLAPVAKDLDELVRHGVDMNKDATVIVKSDRKSIKTVVKADDTGVYVVVASPKKRLTAHDKEGKLLFDGEIDTPEQQEKVPSEIWEKVKPMLERLDSRRSDLQDEVEIIEATPGS